MFPKESSILSDLVQTVNKLKRVHLSGQATQDVIAPPAIPVPPPRHEVKKLHIPVSRNIDEIANMIRPPYYPLRDRNGIIHDTATIAVGCPARHIHKYFITDIITFAGECKCPTCNSGNKYTTRVRNAVEQLFKKPFILTNSSAPNTFSYTNPTIGLTVICPGTSLATQPRIESTRKDNHIYLTILPTATGRLVTQIRAELSVYPELFPSRPRPVLPPAQEIEPTQPKLILHSDKLYIENC